MAKSITKDFCKLMKNIDSFSDGQASVLEYDMDDLSSFIVEFKPNDGPYKGGRFKAQISCCEHYSDGEVPKVIFLTSLYHPNIDSYNSNDYEGESNVCVNLLDEWSIDRNLEDLVMALLFLFYHPQVDDALSGMFGPEITEEMFLENVRLSLKGEDIDGCVFEKFIDCDDNECETIDKPTREDLSANKTNDSSEKSDAFNAGNSMENFVNHEKCDSNSEGLRNGSMLSHVTNALLWCNQFIASKDSEKHSRKMLAVVTTTALLVRVCWSLVTSR